MHEPARGVALLTSLDRNSRFELLCVVGVSV
jgi:hypothetical protein